MYMDSQTFLVISVILTLVLVVLLYIFVLPDAKRASLNKPLRFIHDFLKIRKLMIESIFRFIYVVSVVACVVCGFFLLFRSFLTGLALILLGPVACRIVYELLLLSILLVKNVLEINSHLKDAGHSKDTESRSDYGKTEETAESKDTAESTDTAENEDTEHIKCSCCGTVNSKESAFCSECGNKLH